MTRRRRRRADGRRLWDLKHERPLDRLRVIGWTLVASTNEHLMQFELESGKPRWAF